MGTPPLRVAFEDFELDEARNELRRDGARVDLQPKPLQLLFYLVRHRDRVVPTRELLDQVWPDVIVSPIALSSALREIRQALGDTGTTQRMVQTLRGHGYRFIAEVEEASSEPEPEEKPPTVVEGAEHRLAALLIADVVGYSRLIAEDEDATVRTLAAYREEIELLLRQHRGRLVDFTGDNFLAEFASALAATRCAVEIQGSLRSRNAQLPPERRVEFRMGVHLGDVRVEGERLYGDGVNIAARLQALAEPGGICISGEVHGQVEAKLDLGYEDLGEREVHNIPRPVRVYRIVAEPEAASKLTAIRWRRAALALGAALVVGVLGLLLWQLRPDPSREPISSEGDTETSSTDERFTVPGFGGAPAIAVLPFDNLSGDADQEYFADGIADDLITRLSRFGRFPVIARNSSFAYRGEAIDVKRVGRELGVDYVVEGSVRRAGDRVRISAQLIDAVTGRHVWAERYDRELADVLAVQDEVTLEIAGALGFELAATEGERARGQEVRDLTAWQALLRGWWHTERGEHAEALALYERARELDPGLAGVSEALVGYLTFFRLRAAESDAERERLVAEAVREAERCLALHPMEPSCHTAMAFARRAAGEIDRAIAAFERAIELNPSAGWLHGWLGLARALSNSPDEALASLRTAQRLSPRDAWASRLWLMGAGWAHFAARRYAEAIETAERARTLDPGSSPYRTLAASYGQLGRLEEAHAALEEARRLEPELSLAKVRAENVGTDPDFLERWLEGLRMAGLLEE